MQPGGVDVQHGGLGAAVACERDDSETARNDTVPRSLVLDRPSWRDRLKSQGGQGKGQSYYKGRLSRRGEGSVRQRREYEGLAILSCVPYGAVIAGREVRRTVGRR